MPSPDDERGAALSHRLAERHQGEHTALALVVGPEEDQHVLERDDQHQRPKDQRQNAEDGLAAGKAVAPGGGHCLAKGIKRARADVAVDDADRADHQGPELPAAECLQPAVLGGSIGSPALSHVGRLLGVRRNGARCGLIRLRPAGRKA